MLTMALYNVVDTIYIGRGVGSIGIAAVTVSFPVMVVLMALGQMAGMGAASVISRNLGSGNVHRAQRTLGNTVALSVGSGLLITLVCLPNSAALLQLIGASDAVLPHAKDYLDVILIGAAFAAYPMAMNNLARAEGNARVAMTSMVGGALLNIALDPILIFGLHMGVQGAAIATVIAHLATSIYITRYFLSGHSTLRLSLLSLKLDRSVTREIVSIGFPSFIRMAGMSFLLLIVNRTLGVYGGDLSIAAYGIIHRVLNLTVMPLMGIGQGLQPILGFSYGAKQYGRALAVTRYALVAASGFACATFVVLFFLPAPVIRIFTDDPELIAIGMHASRYVFSAFFVVGFQVVGSVVFQSLGHVGRTLVTSTSRHVLFRIPLILVLPHFFEANGVWLTFPLADALAALLVFLLVFPQLREFKRLSDMQKVEQSHTGATAFSDTEHVHVAGESCEEV
ncbi:MAG: MATE family efflux transporter, partial [Dehalococcoidia bacterium]|nr:MATE family efflux transporter [Dehalococcoidia bacterium]